MFEICHKKIRIRLRFQHPEGPRHQVFQAFDAVKFHLPGPRDTAGHRHAFAVLQRGPDDPVRVHLDGCRNIGQQQIVPLILPEGGHPLPDRRVERRFPFRIHLPPVFFVLFPHDGLHRPDIPYRHCKEARSLAAISPDASRETNSRAKSMAAPAPLAVTNGRSTTTGWSQ